MTVVDALFTAEFSIIFDFIICELALILIARMLSSGLTNLLVGAVGNSMKRLRAKMLAPKSLKGKLIREFQRH